MGFECHLAPPGPPTERILVPVEVPASTVMARASESERFPLPPTGTVWKAFSSPR
ncbi:hypothetical protein EKPV-NSW-ORF183 [Eastern grey kangaroopox virus]|uniref:Uncharacterized protein n=1 Tax=Eastern grey kangaroopox virus TaxID=2042482 RepID=A0A345Z0S3_9POXV|nr:hypothetical protein EKPV-NSW-ORF003 [Eastern grey kangaroopox virus]AXK50194.1 hypothetical protein EKPV-NSW-ORF183 [Eastern grey kangaroopox virus]